MSAPKFVTLRLGKDSVTDIKAIDSLQRGIQSPPYSLTVVCKQVPRTLEVGTYAIIWLGSDNSKGMPTSWKQGIRAIARIERVELGERHNDDSSIGVSIGYIFKSSIDKIGLLESYPSAYIHFSEAPLVGLNDYSNQTIREIDSSPRSDAGVLLTACGKASASSLDGIVAVYPELKEVIRSGLKAVDASPVEIGDLKAAVSPEITEPRNLIFFGAPGTGKSYQLNKLAGENFDKGCVRRVTFYPDYTYSQFVGCFKPYSVPNLNPESPASAVENASPTIDYRFVPGPFIMTYVDAVKHPERNYLLIIEEINRANPAAVFGDVFQLLDRDARGISEYAVSVSEDLHDYLKIQVGPFLKDPMGHPFGAMTPLNDPNLCKATAEIRIPDNMYLWATMNSADQGVFPMDTAFKRRWDFRYMGINDGEETEVDGVPMSKKTITCGGRKVYWNELRKAINKLMIEQCKLNEDKLLGPFFLSPGSLTEERFSNAFKDKVLLYLYEDAGRMKRRELFWDYPVTYSQVCSEFDTHGEGIFGRGFDGSSIWADAEDEADDDAPAEG